MARVQQGDEEAYRALLYDIRPSLLRIVRPYASGPEELEDLVQDVLATLHGSRRTYDPTRPFEPWLYAIARYVAWDHAKRRRRRQASEVLVAEIPERAAAEPLTLSRLDSALEELPAAQREALEMLKIEGLSLEDAAQRAGTTVGAIKLRAHRAYKALRSLLTGGA